MDRRSINECRTAANGSRFPLDWGRDDWTRSCRGSRRTFDERKPCAGDGAGVAVVRPARISWNNSRGMKWRRPNQEADVAPVTNLSLLEIRSQHIDGAIRRELRNPAARIPDSHPMNTDEVFGTHNGLSKPQPSGQRRSGLEARTDGFILPARLLATSGRTRFAAVC